MFVVWLIGLVLAVAAPVILALALARLFRTDTRSASRQVLLGGAIGAIVGFVFSMAIEFVSERRIDGLAEYWYAQVAAGFTVGALAGLAFVGWRIARARAAELL